MATGLYAFARNIFLAPTTALGNASSTAISWGVDTNITCALTSAAYTANLNTDQFFSTINNIVGAVVGTPTAITYPSPATSGGVAGCNAITFTGGITANVTGIVFYKNTGTPTTSLLICFIDSAGSPGFTVVPSGTSQVVVTPATIVVGPPSSGGLFKL